MRTQRVAAGRCGPPLPSSRARCWPLRVAPLGGCRGTQPRPGGTADRLVVARSTRRRQPRPGARQRHRVAGGRRAGLRPPGPLRARPPRARARSGHQLVGERRRHRLDLRAAPRPDVPRRHAGRRRRGRLLVRAAADPRAPGPRAGLRLDARLPQHPPRPRRRPAARAVRDRSPLRAVPGQPGDGTGGDRLADGGARAGDTSSAATRWAPGPYRFVEWIPGDRITLERNPTYWDQPARTRYLVLLAMPDSRSGCRRWSRAPPTSSSSWRPTICRSCASTPICGWRWRRRRWSRTWR